MISKTLEQEERGGTIGKREGLAELLGPSAVLLLVVHSRSSAFRRLGALEKINIRFDDSEELHVLT